MQQVAHIEAQKPSRGIPARKKLISAGLELFGELGFAGASTRDIARKAGQNISAISYYFKNKEGLYKAVLEECLRHKCLEDTISLDAIRALLEDPATTSEVYLTAIKDWLRTRVLALAIQDKRNKSFMKLMFREQFVPTKAFKEFYRTTPFFKQDPFTLLVAAYLDRNPDDIETTLLTHALAGPYIGFLVAPEMVRMKTDWKKLGEKEAAQIADILIAQIEVSLKNLRTAGGNNE